MISPRFRIDCLPLILAFLAGIVAVQGQPELSRAEKLDQKGRRAEAFYAYQEEVRNGVWIKNHGAVKRLAPKLIALADRMDPPPSVPVTLSVVVGYARESLSKSVDLQSQLLAVRDFQGCVELYPWIPELYYYVSVAEEAADLLRAAEAHLQVFLAARPNAQKDGDIQQFQRKLEKRLKEAEANYWENSLGMRFVGVAGTNLRFSIWETREADYELFSTATRRERRFPTTYTPWGIQPAVMVNRDDALAFCAWLTMKERAEGIIRPNQRYRLPTNTEWSIAAGLDSTKQHTFLWGTNWPPSALSGNFLGEEVDATNAIRAHPKTPGAAWWTKTRKRRIAA